jgi:hypothetical protein
MKSRRAKFWWIALGAVGIYLLLPGPLVISDKRWDCPEAGGCSVSFTVRNITPFTVCRKITIGTYTLAGHSRGTYEVQPTGAESITLKLGPHQEQPVNMAVHGGSLDVDGAPGPSVTVHWCWL